MIEKDIVQEAWEDYLKRDAMSIWWEPSPRTKISYYIWNGQRIASNSMIFRLPTLEWSYKTMRWVFGLGKEKDTIPPDRRMIVIPKFKLLTEYHPFYMPYDQYLLWLKWQEGEFKKRKNSPGWRQYYSTEELSSEDKDFVV